MTLSKRRIVVLVLAALMAVAGAFAFSTTPIFSEQAVKQGVDYIVKEEELWARVVIKSKMVRFF